MAWIYQKLFSLDHGKDYITGMCLGIVLTGHMHFRWEKISLSDHVGMVYQDSKKQGRIHHDLVKR